MFSDKDNFEKKNISRRDFMKLIGAGSLFVGLGALGIPNIIKNIREASAQGANATNATNATSGAGTANVTGASTAGGQTTVVMPLGSSAATSGAGYEPPEVTVSPGATVIWDNQDNAIHTATSGKSPNADGKFDSSLVGANQQSKPVTMPTEPGEYPYFCTLHPFLQGTVVVQ